MGQGADPRHSSQDGRRDRGDAKTLKAGVSVVSAPQLFPTPATLAARMVELARSSQDRRC